VLRQIRHVLEYLGVARAHPFQMEQQGGGELGGVGIVHEDGEAFQILGSLGQDVGLPVGDHLQPMLDGAQEAVGGLEFDHRRTRDVAGLRQQVQRPECRGGAHGWIAAAPDELQCLGEEFDLPDAALAQLDVVAGDARHRVRHCAVLRVRERTAFVGIDPLLHGVNVGDRRKIQATPPDERADRL